MKVIDVKGKLPTYREVRKLIQSIPEKQFKIGSMYGYLIAGRASEIVTRICPSDIGYTVANGPHGVDYELADYEGTEVLVLHVKTSKREGLPRDIGVPLRKEPFAEPVYEYFQTKNEDDPVFYYTRQDLGNSTREIFSDYIYPIEPYTIRTVDQEKYDEFLSKIPEELHPLIKPPNTVLNETKIGRHNRRLGLHGSMRHYRTMELAQRYGFSKEERDIYTGHTTSGSDDRYSHLNWRQYFPKLINSHR